MNETYGLHAINNVGFLGGHFIETDGAYYYIPNNCTSNTNTIVFSHGANGDAQNYMDYLKNNNVNAIVAIPKNNLSVYNMNISMDMLNNDISILHNRLGITNNNLFTVSHSAGGISSMYFMIENINNNPEIGPQTCVLFDPAQQDKPDASFITMLTSDQLKTIGDNHSTIIAFEHNGYDVQRALPNYKILGDAGADVVVFGMNNMGSYSPYGDAHTGILQYGFNRGILSYLAGDKSLDKVLDENDDKITVYQYDSSIKDFKEVPISEVSGYIDSILETYSNFNSDGEYYSNVDFTVFNSATTNLKAINDLKAVSSDQEYIVSEMNSIRNVIKQTRSLSNIKNINCKSTTSVPTCAENFLYDYFNSTLNLLNKIEQETRKAIEIGNVIDEGDKELEKTANELNNKIYTVHGFPANNFTDETLINAIDEKLTDDKGAYGNNSYKQNQTINPVMYDTNSLLNKDICDKVYDITAEDLNKLFERWAKETSNPNSPLLGTGEYWIKACNETGLDPLTLIGICGTETNKGSSDAMNLMKNNNFLGIEHINTNTNDINQIAYLENKAGIFNGDANTAILDSAKKIKNFYYGEEGCTSIAKIGNFGYSGVYGDTQYAYKCAQIMKESLDYIMKQNGNN